MVLLPDDAVLYDSQLNVGEVVKFIYPGFKSPLEGDVKGISDDYDAMVDLQTSLNAKKPKPDSFHEENPRKAAVKCKGEFLAKVTGKKKGGSDGKSTNTRPSQSVSRNEVKKTSKPDEEEKTCKSLRAEGRTENNRASDSDDPLEPTSPSHRKESGPNKSKSNRFRNMLSSSDSSSDSAKEENESNIKGGVTDKSDDSDSDDDFNPSPEEIAKWKKFTKKRQQSDFRNLQDLNLKRFCPLPRDDTKTRDDKDSSDKLTPPTPTRVKSVTHDTPPSSNVKKWKMKKEVTMITFEGESLAYTAKDEKVQLLHNDHPSVFIKKRDFEAAKSRHITPSSFTRQLCRCIFKQEAREKCSVSGKPSMVKGQEKPEVRTALNQAGVAAIIDAVAHRAKKKGWRVPDSSAIKQYMGNLLCEERGAARLREEEAAGQEEGTETCANDDKSIEDEREAEDKTSEI